MSEKPKRTVTVPRWLFVLMVICIAASAFVYVGNLALDLIGVPK